MSDCSPLRLADNENSSPSQSIGSQGSQDGGSRAQQQMQNQQQAQQQSSRQQPSHHHHNHHDRNHGESNANRTRSQSESSSKDGQLRYGAKNVIELFIPVSLCMVIVVGTMKATDGYRYSSQTAIWYAQMMFTDQSVDTGTRVWQSFVNALIMLCLIVVMTTVLILLYKFRCYATIHGWLILSSLILLFMFAIMYIAEILKVYNIPMDAFTLAIFIWNFGVVGMICIHWKGPLLLQQAYLITISALLALVFIRSLPDWTTWTVLGIVSIWDLVAVLCPRGPLRILVETAQERNEAIFPALIYSSTMVWEVFATSIVTSVPSISMADQNNTRPAESSESGKRRGKRNPNKQSSSNQPQASSSFSTSPDNRRQKRTANGQNLRSPSKRNQHPVEIHYEDGAQPPEVAFVQPNLTSTNSAETATNNDLNGPVRSIRNVRQLPEGTPISQARVANEANATEHSIEFQPNDSRADHSMEEERGVKLGLGDFIFFSLLVGKASSYGDWTITLSCYVAILVGLCLTLSLLAVFRKALPALPISIAFGLSAFFLSYVFVVPFSERLASDQIFI